MIITWCASTPYQFLYLFHDPECCEMYQMRIANIKGLGEYFLLQSAITSESVLIVL